MAEPKRRADFEKLVIGPMMVLAEMTTGGHYMEMLKIIRQAKNVSYGSIAADLWKNEGFLGFYKGFMPWGAIQMVKGIPVLFVQGESDHYLKSMGVGNKTAETLAGVAGGIAQGVFITPTQRLKTIVMTDPKYSGTSAPKTAVDAFKATTNVAFEVVRSDGLGTLFKGLGPMMAKRGMDWGLRFWGVSFAKQQLTKDNPKRELSVLERLGIGFFGGAASTLTMPFDSWVANCQKASKTGSSQGAISVAKEMWRAGGAEPFLRGWVMRLMHAGYHTMWMTTIGTMLFEYIKGPGATKGGIH
eukprot:TRINITY_DN20329_c0_g1_i1.p1 TRINITY_DN20329_c0_g1~~TRINITY_DN20329_c0_g1_i1.p1  ORF type:complete len:309 (+),score=50.66 TRINITY_DN20329_c0_g1_i1:28-927(+)